MADESQLEILEQGVDVWNDWRRRAEEAGSVWPDLASSLKNCVAKIAPMTLPY